MMGVAKRKIEFAVRDSTGPLDTPLGADLRQLEAKIAGSETTGLEARWEFGRHLLRQRDGKQLAKGLLNAIVTEIGIGRREIGYRLKFAEAFPSKDKLCNALQSCSSWREVIKAMPKSPRKPKDVASPYLSRLTRARKLLVEDIYEHREDLTEDELREIELILDAIAEIKEAMEA